MANNRVFYAMKRFGIGPSDASSFIQGRGTQQVGVTTTFNLEQVFELGQISLFDQIEGVPDVSLNASKVLDGRCPPYLLSTGQGTASSALLVDKAKESCSAVVAIYSETDSIAGGDSTALSSSDSYFVCKDLQVSSVEYSISTDSDATESVTYVGNDKEYSAGSVGSFLASSTIAEGDSPLANTGVSRREDIDFTNTRLPTDMPGITNSSSDTSFEYGTVSSSQVDNNEIPVQIQSISISASLTREAIPQLGTKENFTRVLTFPAEVTTEFTIHSLNGDGLSALVSDTSENTKDQNIRIALKEGLIIDLGTKNRLTSISLTGADAGGGNQTFTLSYQTFNDFTVVHSQAPDAESRTLPTLPS